MKSIIIYSFMIKDLKLKGLELLIYALIYSFSQFGQKCYMTAETIADVVGCSRSQVFRVIKVLLAVHFIDYDHGYFCRHMEHIDEDLKNKLNEMIRIAKTPWLDE